ncbi:flavodoxin family protein [Arthrobacter sp. BF1]|uniref:flavodoxin family protein n=1 Tax=Arthrobacter sp. BF1 TaxID=2821145 RepID=UPI001C4F3353|nr:NAD(P)H-dependent oxidoreductase [Arthrobacter sp. BF1]
MTDLSAIAIVCSLTPSPEPSSSEVLARQVLADLEKHGVTRASLRIVDHEIKPGVKVDMGDGDEWPTIRASVLAAAIVVLATPIWMGHPCSLAQQVLERLDADLSETDDQGRPIMFGKVAIVAVVGNEDGAHNVIADMMQGMNDVGFTFPAQGSTYWVGEAMQTMDYKDLDTIPEAVASATAVLSRNAAHLARVFRNENYPSA